MTRVLGMDYGDRRIGFAVSDPDGQLALPVGSLEGRAEAEVFGHVRDLCSERGVGRIVVGLPVNMDGTRGPAAKKAEAFAARLQAALGMPVETWDERLSTVAVERAMRAADLSAGKRKASRDKMAAQAILQNYLDAQAYRSLTSSNPDP
jgi:putative Holliday junction resolvase